MNSGKGQLPEKKDSADLLSTKTSSQRYLSTPVFHRSEEARTSEEVKQKAKLGTTTRGFYKKQSYFSPYVTNTMNRLNALLVKIQSDQSKIGHPTVSKLTEIIQQLQINGSSPQSIHMLEKLISDEKFQNELLKNKELEINFSILIDISASLIAAAIDSTSRNLFRIIDLKEFSNFADKKANRPWLRNYQEQFTKNNNFIRYHILGMDSEIPSTLLTALFKIEYFGLVLNKLINEFQNFFGAIAIHGAFRTLEIQKLRQMGSSELSDQDSHFTSHFRYILSVADLILDPANNYKNLSRYMTTNGLPYFGVYSSEITRIADLCNSEKDDIKKQPLQEELEKISKQLSLFHMENAKQRADFSGNKWVEISVPEVSSEEFDELCYQVFKKNLFSAIQEGFNEKNHAFLKHFSKLIRCCIKLPTLLNVLENIESQNNKESIKYFREDILSLQKNLEDLVNEQRRLEDEFSKEREKTSAELKKELENRKKSSQSSNTEIEININETVNSKMNTLQTKIIEKKQLVLSVQIEIASKSDDLRFLEQIMGNNKLKKIPSSLWSSSSTKSITELVEPLESPEPVAPPPTPSDGIFSTSGLLFSTEIKPTIEQNCNNNMMVRPVSPTGK